MFQFEAWPTESRKINQKFGRNKEIYQAINKALHGHEGIDVRAGEDTKIFAVADGTVTRCCSHVDEPDHAYGSHVHIEHSDGYRTIYAHLNQIDVTPDQTVTAGQQIGLAGSTGNSTGPHLHLTLKKAGIRFKDKHGVWPNNLVDPEPFLLPLLGIKKPAGPYTTGWVYKNSVTVHESGLGQAASDLNLRAQPSKAAKNQGIVPRGTMMIVTGGVQGDGQYEYYPVQVPSVSFVAAKVGGSSSTPAPTPVPTPTPPHSRDETLGWAYTTAITVRNGVAKVGQGGIRLRDAPRRTGELLGLVQYGTEMAVTGEPQGEYTPVRLDSAEIYPATRSGIADNTIEDATISAIKIGIQGRQFDPAIQAAARADLYRISERDDPATVQKVMAEDETAAWWLAVTNANNISDTLVQWRNRLAARPLVVEVPNMAAMAPTRSKLIAADVLVRLPIANEQWSTYDGADGVVLLVPLVSAPEDIAEVMGWVEEATSVTRYKPLWVLVDSDNYSPAVQAASFLAMWGALQAYPVVEGVVLSAHANNADDLLQIADMIGAR